MAADRAAYDAYNAHPDHVAFVSERWTSEVADFLEIDFAGPTQTPHSRYPRE